MTPPSWVAYAARTLERERRRDDHEHRWVVGSIVGRSKTGWLVGSDCMICGVARYPSTLTPEDRADMERLGYS